jgi:hypothetical protein
MWRVKNWDTIYENNRSRVIENTSWVPIPNKHDSDGYTLVIEHDHGAMHYGAWCALVQVASKCKPRGTLVRDGKPHTAESLARQTKIPASVFREAIPRFLSPEIGWLEEVNVSRASGGRQATDASLLSDFFSMSSNGTERTERNGGKEQKELPAGPVGGRSVISEKPSGPDPVSEPGDPKEWAKVARIANRVVSDLYPSRNWELNPLSDKDRHLFYASAYLAVTRLGVEWLDKAVKETLDGKPSKTIVGFFKKMLWKKPHAEGIDLNALLDAVQVPERKRT